jgi:hypothetical protein
MTDESTEELEQRVNALAQKAESDPDALSDEEWAFLEEMANRDDVPEVEVATEE